MSNYTESEAVRQAQALLQQQLAQKPGAYQSEWQTQLNDTINKILNREKFSYDLNGDALYQQYKDQYTTQGKMAMMDTMGQAQAMTGGYGNSYAQTAGQQTYQGYLQKLNDKVPELYQLALNQYNQEGQDLYNKYSLLGSQEEQDYNRHQDAVANWQTEYDRLQNQYNTEREFDYGKYADDRNYQYQVDRDKVADEQWQKEFDEAVRQYNYTNKLGEFAPTTTTSTPSGSKKNTNPTTTPTTTPTTPATDTSYYSQLLGAVSTAKGAYSKQTVTERQKAYKESVAAINSAYSSGKITATQKAELLKIATPSSR